MTQDLIEQSYRGVYCQSCRQPIPLPSIVLNIESSLNQTVAGFEEEGGNRAFSLRCRSCDKEMPYGLRDVAVIKGAPKPRVSRVHGRHGRGQRELSRAANG